jgi:hypothetical protein
MRSKKWSDSTNPREVGYSIALGKLGETSVYENVAKDPPRMINFVRAVKFSALARDMRCEV